MFRIATSSLLFLIVCAKCDSINNCDSVECLDKELIQYIDGLDEGGDIGDFIAITKINSSVERVHREEDIIGRCSRYLAEHELKLRIPLSEARSLEAGRTKKLRRVILPILLLLKLKAAIVIPVVLSLIALVAFNGLGAGVTALAIAGATGLKSLLESHGPSKVSYEIVPQVIAPQWSRSSSIEENLQDVLPMKAGYHTLPWK